MGETVTVHLGMDSYDVRIDRALLGEAGRAAVDLGRVRTAVVISDATVANLYAGAVMASLEETGVAAALIDFPAGETSKTLATYKDVMDRLLALEPPIDRDSVLLALGGGVTGDLAGFVAATALRGLRWIQCPTTLLADVDASVGGKTAVDHAAGKNLIGAFHQPRAVLIDVETLRTLPDEELRNGLAECVKHGMIRDAGLIDLLESGAEEIFAHRPETMIDLVRRNVAVKARVVEADPRETGERAHLNFGHTIGHAIERCAGYDAVRHGEAVSLGMVAACRLARDRGLIGQAIERRLRTLLERLGLPVSAPDVDLEAIWRIMQHDKKVRDGKVRMILPTRLGAVEIFDDIDMRSVRQALEGIAEDG